MIPVISREQEEDQMAEALRIWRSKSAEDKFAWAKRPGFDFSHVDPQEAGARMTAMAEENGWQLTPAMLVEEGKDEKSVLYPCFEHDMVTAAELWGVHTARNLANSMRTIKIYKDKDGERKQVTVNTFQNLKVDGKNAYVPIQIIARNPILANQVINRLLDEARLLAVKAREVGLFSKVVEAIDELPQGKMPEWVEVVVEAEDLEGEDE